MSENTNNNGQSSADNSFNPMNGLPRNTSTEQDIASALRIISDAIQRNPDAFNLGRRAPTESQSNYAQSKWKFEREQH